MDYIVHGVAKSQTRLINSYRPHGHSAVVMVVGVQLEESSSHSSQPMSSPAWLADWILSLMASFKQLVLPSYLKRLPVPIAHSDVV